jgi:hypothetical protein
MSTYVQEITEFMPVRSDARDSWVAFCLECLQAEIPSRKGGDWFMYPYRRIAVAFLILASSPLIGWLIIVFTDRSRITPTDVLLFGLFCALMSIALFVADLAIRRD